MTTTESVTGVGDLASEHMGLVHPDGSECADGCDARPLRLRTRTTRGLRGGRGDETMTTTERQTRTGRATVEVEIDGDRYRMSSPDAARAAARGNPTGGYTIIAGVRTFVGHARPATVQHQAVGCLEDGPT